MSLELAMAAGVMIAASVAGAGAGWLIARRSKAFGAVAAGVTVALLLTHACWLKDNLLLARVIPSANVMVWGNVAAPAAGLLAGAAAALLQGPRWQRILFPCVVLSIGAWRSLAPLLGTPAKLGPGRVIDGVCRQSSTASCSAAAAATVLLAHHFQTDEAEMAKLCLTHRDGTTQLGLYRGLKLKAEEAGASIRIADVSFDELVRGPLPAAVTISSPEARGWLSVGNAHSIVVFAVDRSAQTLEIGDPFAGRQQWSRAEFERNATGHALFVETNRSATTQQ